jgi:hypothetical protein
VAGSARACVTDAVASFDALLDAYHEAAAASGEVERHFELGGIAVRVCFAGEALVPAVTTVFAHREVKARSEDLTVCIWDSASTGVRTPFRPWRDDPECTLGEIRGYHGARIGAVYEGGVNFVHLVDRERALGVSWIGDARRVPQWWVSSFPLRLPLHLWLRDKPYQLVHAGAVGLAENGVLLAGRSGSGKSTSALACLDSPLVFAGDDYVLVELHDLPRVHNLYGIAKVEEDVLARFPRLQPLVNGGRQPGEKPMVSIAEHLPAKLGSGFQARAILLPRVTGLRETKVRPASKVEALTALAPTTVIQLRVDQEQAFAKMSDLVRQVPSYWLEAGTELERIPDAIEALLR